MSPIVKALRIRLMSIGLNREEMRAIPADEVRKVISGEKMIVTIKTSDVCPCCKRRVYIVMSYPVTQTPLEELFK